MNATRERIALPAGRLLYRPCDEARNVVVRHDRSGELWIVEDGWSSDSAAAGPFHPSDVLRALRLANTNVPDGCERVAWQSGIALFERTELPSHPNDWSRLEPAWLTPSVTRYSASDANPDHDETCCAPARDTPRIDWRKSANGAGAELVTLIGELHPDLVLSHHGSLRREWNAHPAGSLVFAPRPELSAAFLVVDLPAP